MNTAEIAVLRKLIRNSPTISNIRNPAGGPAESFLEQPATA